MIRDSLGLFSDAQTLSYTSGGSGAQITQSTDWMEMSEHTDKLGIVTYPDMAPGKQLYVHFRVTTAFLTSVTDAGATLQVIVYSDSSGTPSSGSISASYLGSATITNNGYGTGAGYTLSLALGQGFVIPIGTPQGGARNPEVAVARGVGKRYIGVAYVLTHSVACITTGGIEAILSNDSMMVGAQVPLSKYSDGIYPANVDWGQN